MTWCLRTNSYEELEQVARRFGSEVVTGGGGVRPDGSVESHAMAPGGAAHPWLRGLPNWYYHRDMSAHPSRSGDQRRPLREIAWLEVGGESSVYQEHLGDETFESLPLRFVDRPCGLYGLAVTTDDGDEITIRRDSAAALLPGLMSDLLSA